MESISVIFFQIKTKTDALEKLALTLGIKGGRCAHGRWHIFRGVPAALFGSLLFRPANILPTLGDVS